MLEPSVLLVDDEAQFVGTLAKRLVRRGLRVETALGGQEALDLLDQGGASRIDVVILDVKMPGMDGLETLSRLKAHHPNVGVIMLTGHGTVESAIEGMKRGAYDFLLKPADLNLLLDKVHEACEAKRRLEMRILEARAQLMGLKEK
ncbi:MAG: response regulator [Deltaproteobacteria bacterium]|nr:response regulator [Deltaproteobacteria bacterium]